MEILKVENLTKIYGKGTTKVVALDNVSLYNYKLFVLLRLLKLYFVILHIF